MDGQIDEATKEKRFHALMKAQNKISKKLHKKFIGKTMKVIIDGVSEETDLLLQGRTSQQAPGIDGVVLISEGKAKPGEMVDVLITDSHDYDLVGRII